MTETTQFEQFMRNYQNMVFTTALRILASEAEAQDVAQEVFLKAYHRFAELGQSPTAGGWLRTVTTNLCLNHLTRYRNRWKFFSEMFSPQDSESDDLVFDLPAAETTGDYMEEADQRRILDQELMKLPAAQRVPLILYHFEGQSYDEIADALKISLSKVKTDILRGRAALRKKLMTSHAGGREIASESMEPVSHRIRETRRLGTFNRILSTACP